MHRPPLPSGIIPGTYLCWRLSQFQGHSAAEKIISIKNSNDTNGCQTSNLSACGAVPQPTALRRNFNSAAFSYVCGCKVAIKT